MSQICKVFLLTSCLSFVSVGQSLIAADPESSDASVASEQLRMFNDAILPIFQEHCFDCHSTEEQRGGLSLDSRAGLVLGGDSGPAFDENTPEASLILEAVRYEGYEMPPSGKLPVEDIAKIELWISGGAAYPVEMQGSNESQRPAAPGAEITEKDRQHWAFQPLVQPIVPDVANRDLVANPIDAFIVDKLEQENLSSGPAAEPAALLRRLHYDLTGLPPSNELVQAFIADPSDQNYVRIVDQLLASPEYGQRWGRHWLDLVRYAETNSYERDGAKPEVWRFRDYVIDSFNSDKSFEEFTSEQIAGDELPFEPDHLVATGYYRLGLWDDEPADPLLARYDELDDLVRTTGQVFLGLTVDCARCHDHKIDPISQADYYRFLSFFSGTNRYGIRGGESVERNSLRPMVPLDQGRDYIAAVESYRKQKQKLERRLLDVHEKIREDFEPVEHEEFRHEMNRIAIVKKRVGTILNDDEFTNYERAANRLRELERTKPAELAMALCVTEQGSIPEPSFVLTRGNPHSPAAPVEPGFPEVISDPIYEGGFNPPIGESPNPETSGRRSVLAGWLTNDQANPLTPRVIANRIWQYHFGRGIVRTPSDFGYQGTPPTHPELLDWLAIQLVESDWHLKVLHRTILTSHTYRLATIAREPELSRDPTNDMMWRFDPRRLSAEEIRDSMLSASKHLNFRFDGPSMYPIVEAEVLAGQSRPGDGWHDSSAEERSRRSVYIHVKRSLQVPLLASFDMADTDFTCPVRFATTQPTQALGMINSDFVRNQARLLAAQVVGTTGEDSVDFVTEVIARVTQRSATDDEIKRGFDFIKKLIDERGETASQAREHFALIALNLNEFIYLD